LSVDPQTRTINGATSTIDTVTIVTDGGEMQTVPLDPGVSVRILEHDLSDEVSKYLAVVSSARERDVRRLSIAASGTGDRDLFVSYVSEVPVWKATYRLIVPDAGDSRKPLLQGWAIVDNTVGEDWTNVQLSLAAGAPQAFVQAISQPYYVRRPVVSLPDGFQLTPQTHQSAVTTSPGSTTAAGAGGGARTFAGLPNNRYNVTIDGVTSSNVFNSSDGFFALTTPRLDAVEELALRANLKQARENQTNDADAAAMGDLFEYKLKEPITIRRGQSALVPILSSDIAAEKVSLWNTRLNSRRALRSFWITNSTGSTLDGGTFSVVDGQAFAGEGLMDPLKAGERRLLSYAVDLGLTLDAGTEPLPETITRVSVADGVLVQSTERRRRLTYVARNQDEEQKTLIVEHPRERGWSIAGDATPVETTPDWHRFRITVAPRATASLAVDERQSVATTVRLTDLTDQQLLVMVTHGAIPAALEASLRDVQAKKAELARLVSDQAKRSTTLDQITRDQDRVRENMKSLKGSSEERQLLQRYVRQLDEQETRIDTLRTEIQALGIQMEKAKADLAKAIQAMR
jgi:hypothetical protein